MNLSYPTIENYFSFSDDKVNTLIIENQTFFSDFVTDIYKQINGLNGKSVLSENNVPILFSKNADLLYDFIDFNINKKSLLTKIISVLEKKAQFGEYIIMTKELLSQTEKFLYDISFDFDCKLIYNKLNIGSVFKGCGIEIADDYDNLSEKILDYMELVRQFDTDKLFIMVNFRCFTDNITAQKFIDSVISHNFKVFMIESKTDEILINENRITIDKDLCEF